MHFRSFLAVVVSLTAAVWAQPSLKLDPAVITSCGVFGLGRTRVIWSNAGSGPVTIRLSGPTGTPVTGPMPPDGQVDTLTWVVDGMVFSLADSNNNELARATASLRCAPDASTDAAGSYFPLSVGNEWVYQTKSRLGGPYYVNQRVQRAQLDSAGVLWHVIVQSSQDAVSSNVLTSEAQYRTDEQGRIHVRGGDGSDQIYLDPSGGPSHLTINSKGFPLQTQVGRFSDSLTYQTFTGGLLMETGALVRGLGRANSTVIMLSGSSGGFSSGVDLVYARIGNQTFSISQPALEISAENSDLDVSGKNVTNCALPCYFVACGIAFPSPDPPGTYKPCFQARVRIRGGYTNSGITGATVTFTLLDSLGNTVDSGTLPVIQSFESVESVIGRQLKLYNAPNVPVAPGAYQLRASLVSGGVEQASSTMNLNVR